MALFIAFEGGEGSGKSTQAKALYRRFLNADIPVILTHEPGGTAWGEEVRCWLKGEEEMKISAWAELLLFAACRSQLVAEVLRPNLATGVMVICDRYADSTIAYQGYGRGIDLDTIQTINGVATQGLVPDVVILVDVPVEIGLARRKTAKLDRFEKEGVSFHHRVRQGYLQLAAAAPQRWLVVDALLSEAEIEQAVWEKVAQLLE